MGTLDPRSSITDNEITARGEFPGAPDGCAADFETNATGAVFARNFLSRAFGAGIMLLGHTATSNRGIVLANNTLLRNGCGSRTNPDHGAVAFMSPGSSGEVAGNVFVTCAGVPVLNDAGDPGLPMWRLFSNVVDGEDGVAVLVPATPVVTATGGGGGGLLLKASCATPGAALQYTVDGSRPTLDSAPLPGDGLQFAAGFRAVAVFVKAFALGSQPEGTVVVESESEGCVWASTSI